MDRRFADSPLTWGDVLRIWQELEVQEGWRPEITPGAIRIAPPPREGHKLAAAMISRALVEAADESFAVLASQGVAVPSAGGIFMPDLCVVKNQVPSGPEPIDSVQVAVAVEITYHGTEQADLEWRISAYALGGIAQFLLVDVFDDDGPAVFAFSRPRDGAYRKILRMALGEKIELGDPVPAVIDSSLFPALTHPGYRSSRSGLGFVPNLTSRD